MGQVFSQVLALNPAKKIQVQALIGLGVARRRLKNIAELVPLLEGQAAGVRQ